MVRMTWSYGVEHIDMGNQTRRIDRWLGFCALEPSCHDSLTRDEHAESWRGIACICTEQTDATMAVILTSIKASHACNDKQHIHSTGFTFTILVERIRVGSRRLCKLSMKGVSMWRICDRRGEFQQARASFYYIQVFPKRGGIPEYALVQGEVVSNARTRRQLRDEA